MPENGICIVISVLFTFALCLVSCGYYEEGKADAVLYGRNNFDAINNLDIMDSGPVKGGRLKLFSTFPDTLNPLFTNNAYVQEFGKLIFEGLASLGKDQMAVPLLSDSWEVSEDGLIWTFHIRDGVLWHDGVSFTAEDVEYTLKTILNAKTDSVYKWNLQNISAFAALDRNNIRIVLKKPNSFMPEMLTLPIIPKHYYSGMDIGFMHESKLPPGTGPYKYQSYEDGKSIILAANEKWWKISDAYKDKNEDIVHNGASLISEITINLYRDSRCELAAFQALNTDIARIENINYDKYTQRTDLLIKEYADRDCELIAFNISKPPLNEKAVRQAIALGIDKEKLIGDFLLGKAVRSDIPVMPDSWIYDRIDEPYAFDMKKAEDLLEQIGWKKQDGLRYNKINGAKKTLDINILVNNDNRIRVALAEKISGQLKEIGINSNVAAVSGEEAFKRINSRKFDMAVIGLRMPLIPDVSFLFSTPYLSQPLIGDKIKAVNIAGYYNEEVNNYITEIFARNGRNERKEAFAKLRAKVLDDAPYILLFFYKNAVICRNSVRGRIEPYVWNKFGNIEEWYIP